MKSWAVKLLSWYSGFFLKIILSISEQKQTKPSNKRGFV